MVRSREETCEMRGFEEGFRYEIGYREGFVRVKSVWEGGLGKRVFIIESGGFIHGTRLLNEIFCLFRYLKQGKIF